MTTPITPIPPSSFLLHAVGGVARGSYVVVGEPEGDGSVADAFYARGWRGITVVSSSGTEEAAAARRPQDVVVVRPPGSAGWGRLADALAKSPGEVQVLVTAAGHESVLAELDQAHVRPWVVAVLAMQGHDDVPPAPDQGGVLAGAGYRRVLFDGATDYYVAPAHLELREAFRVTVDASGGLQADAGSPEIRAELERTRALVTHLERWAEAAENWARTAEQRYDESRLDLDEAAARDVEELSAGERSRLSVARALAADAEVLGTLTLPYTVPGTGEFSAIHSNPPGIYTDSPAIVRRRIGSSTLLWTAAPIELMRPYQSHVAARNLICSLIAKPSFTSDAPKYVEMLAWQKDGRTFMAAINQQETPPVVPVHDIHILWPAAGMRAVRLVTGEPLHTETINGQTNIHLPKLDIFDMFELI